MKTKPIIYLLVLFASKNLAPIIAQELNSDQEQQIEEITETISDDAVQDYDNSALFDNLNELAENPVNLNTASENELQQLNMLTPFQIAQIIDYRKKVGNIRSIYELGYLPGFREIDIQIIQSYVTCEESSPPPEFIKPGQKNIKTNFLIRYQRIIEKSVGYYEISDSALTENPNKSRYLGSPDKLYLRYGVKIDRRISAGLVMEKDAGEEFFSGSNKKGFDFYSAHLLYKDEHRFIQTLALGDYHVELGQGLLMWSSYAGFKSGSSRLLAKRPVILKRSFSASEERFLRGAALTVGKKDFSITIFGSFKKTDATIITDSTGSKQFTRFSETGYHNTPTELAKEDQLPLTMLGFSARYDANRLKTGINGIYTSYGIPPQKSNELYNFYDFSNRKLTGISADYRYLARKFNFFGEVAYSNQSLAILNGLEIYLKHGWYLGAIQRFYEPSYYSHFNGAFGENTETANENGLFLGTEAHLEKLSFKIYGDIYSFPWLKSEVNAPSEGSEMFLETAYTFKTINLSVRYKKEEKPRNSSAKDNILRIVTPFTRQQLRFNAVYSCGNLLKLQSRIEFAMAGFSDSTKHFGYCLIQDLHLSNLKLPVDQTFRIAYFDINDYDARIYTYETDVLYAFSSQMFDKKGWRIAYLIKWKPADYISFYLKYSLSLFPDETSISSGLNQINTNHRQEIKAELVFRF